MTKLRLAGIFLIGCLPVFGANKPDAEGLFNRAERQANLFRDGANPFQLDVDFLAQFNIPIRGHLTLKWEGKNRWRSEVVIGEFEQTTVRKDDMQYISRNAGFTPLRVGQLLGLLRFATDHDGQIAKKAKRRTDKGVEMDCLQVVPEPAKGSTHEVCVNSSSLEIQSDEWHEPPDEHRQELFSDYSDFGEVRYPRKLEFLEDGIKVLTANVIDIQNSTFNDSLLVAPKDAIERRECAGMKNAIPVNTPDPLYPKSAGQNRQPLDTTVAITVSTDGSVADVQIVGKATQPLDEATLQTLKGWKFKPAMCGTEPVVSDVVVVESFR